MYTGILKFLETEDQFAGVLGHEIGHADMRHSTRQMTKMYGIQILLDILAGDKKMLKEITAGIVGLKFSREHETKADQRSVGEYFGSCARARCQDSLFAFILHAEPSYGTCIEWHV